MSIAEKLVTIAENEQKVYDAGNEKGRQAESEAFWNVITNHNNPSAWSGKFKEWDCEYLRPPFVIAPTKGNINAMFEANKKLKKVESEYFDFSNYVCGQTSTSTNAWYRTFFDCLALEEVEDLGMQTGGYFYTYNNCQALKKIAVMRVQADTQYNNHLNNCIALENLTVEGTIGQNGFNAKWSTKLFKASILSILRACNKASAGVTITLPKVCPNLNAEVGAPSGTTLETVLIGVAYDLELTDAWTAAYHNGYTIAYA